MWEENSINYLKKLDKNWRTNILDKSVIPQIFPLLVSFFFIMAYASFIHVFVAFWKVNKDTTKLKHGVEDSIIPFISCLKRKISNLNLIRFVPFSFIFISSFVTYIREFTSIHIIVQFTFIAWLWFYNIINYLSSWIMCNIIILQPSKLWKRFWTLWNWIKFSLLFKYIFELEFVLFLFFSFASSTWLVVFLKLKSSRRWIKTRIELVMLHTLHLRWDKFNCNLNSILIIKIRKL